MRLRSEICSKTNSRTTSGMKWNQSLPRWVRVIFVLFGVAIIVGALASFSDMTLPVVAREAWLCLVKPRLHSANGRHGIDRAMPSILIQRGASRIVTLAPSLFLPPAPSP